MCCVTYQTPSKLQQLWRKFSISHTLYCNKGGLITTCNNELHDMVADMDRKAFKPSHVCDGNLIHTGPTMQSINVQP